MDIWLDNTGLQAAGRCLTEGARSDYDVRGLLQLSTLVVFANGLELTGFEPDEIAITTSQFRDEIVSIGLEPSALKIGTTSRAEYASACKSAAVHAASDLPFIYRRDERQLLGLGPLDLTRGDIRTKFDFIRRALETDDVEAFEKIAALALNDKSAGAIEYMLSVSPNLRAAVTGIMDKLEEWTEDDGWQLESILRSYLNDSLGRQTERIYAPAVSRAELIQRQNVYVLERLEGELQSMVRELNQKVIGIPSTHAALLEIAKGDPRGVIDGALEMRRKAGPFRQTLAELTKLALNDGPVNRFEIDRELKNVAQQVRYALNLDRAPRFLDAFDLQIVIGLPEASLSPSKLYDWVYYQLSKKRLAVITEIAKLASFAGNTAMEYQKLAQRCSRGRLYS